MVSLLNRLPGWYSSHLFPSRTVRKRRHQARLNAESLETRQLLAAAAVPTISISDPIVTEGNSGTKLATFTVSLSEPSTVPVIVSYATVNGTAVAGTDYTAKAGVLTFSAGVATQTVSVIVTGDTMIEGDERFALNLAAPMNATLSDSRGVAVIVNDDFPTVSVGDITLTEGNSGTKLATFTVSLSAAGTSPVTVSYATANGTAIAGSDYTAKSGVLTFPVGVKTQTVSVVITGDTKVEGDERFALNLSSPTKATISDSRAVAVIVNDDFPTVSVGDIRISEGNSGTKLATFTVSLSAAGTSPVTVSYATANGTAIAGSDYTAKSGVLTFPVGVRTQTVSVVITGDTKVEGDERFALNLSAPTKATISDSRAVAVIVNDDIPAISIADANVVEGDTGTRLVTFTVSLSAAFSSAVSVNYATADGTALAGRDYTSASGTLTFAAGVRTRTFTISILGDYILEGDDRFAVNLSSPVNATISDRRAVGVIVNDD